MSADPYVYPGTDVLKNRLGLRDADDLRRFEAHAVRLRELELRQRPASPPFDLPAHLEREADRLFAELRNARHLQGLPQGTFVDRLAYFLGEVNALHPFREGNGRSQRELFRRVALCAGWSLDFDAMDADENIAASIEATLRSHDRMRTMLSALVSRL